MRICIKSEGQNINIPIPTGIIFSKASAWVCLKIVRSTTSKYVPEQVRQTTDAVLNGLTDKAVYALFAEILRIKRKYGSWELVDVASSDGDVVKIIL